MAERKSKHDLHYLAEKRTIGKQAPTSAACSRKVGCPVSYRQYANYIPWPASRLPLPGVYYLQLWLSSSCENLYTLPLHTAPVRSRRSQKAITSPSYGVHSAHLGS